MNKGIFIGGLIGAPIGLYVHWTVFRALSDGQQLTIQIVGGIAIFVYIAFNWRKW